MGKENDQNKETANSEKEIATRKENIVAFTEKGYQKQKEVVRNKREKQGWTIKEYVANPDKKNQGHFVLEWNKEGKPPMTANKKGCLSVIGVLIFIIALNYMMSTDNIVDQSKVKKYIVVRLENNSNARRDRNLAVIISEEALTPETQKHTAMQAAKNILFKEEADFVTVFMQKSKSNTENLVVVEYAPDGKGISKEMDWTWRIRQNGKEITEKISEPDAYSELRKKKESIKSMAFTICKVYIKNRLKSPSSADFPFADVYKEVGQKYQYRMKSYVDSKNIFGAMMRTHFFCRSQFKGGDVYQDSNWKILEFSTE